MIIIEEYIAIYVLQVYHMYGAQWRQVKQSRTMPKAWNLGLLLILKVKNYKTN